jgi:hypothetical protein
MKKGLPGPASGKASIPSQKKLTSVIQRNRIFSYLGGLKETSALPAVVLFFKDICGTGY